MLMKQLRRQRGLHVNPWSHFPRLITPIDFLKRERPMQLFREILPPEGDAAFRATMPDHGYRIGHKIWLLAEGH